MSGNSLQRGEITAAEIRDIVNALESAEYM
jgi:hypothetical protein